MPAGKDSEGPRIWPGREGGGLCKLEALDVMDPLCRDRHRLAEILRLAEATLGHAHKHLLVISYRNVSETVVLFSLRSLQVLESRPLTVKDEMGAAGFVVNFFKGCRVDLWLVWLCRIDLKPGGTDTEGANT